MASLSPGKLPRPSALGCAVVTWAPTARAPRGHGMRAAPSGRSSTFWYRNLSAATLDLLRRRGDLALACDVEQELDHVPFYDVPAGQTRVDNVIIAADDQDNGARRGLLRRSICRRRACGGVASNPERWDPVHQSDTQLAEEVDAGSADPRSAPESRPVVGGSKQIR
jgi:hypothetical protein